MQYKSPIPLLKYAGGDLNSLDANSLLKIQKRLLVELDLSGQGSIQIDGQSITKDDILTVIEDLKSNGNVQFHQWIYENPSLLDLLQKGDTDEMGVLYFGSLAYHYGFKNFKTFISPYLAQPLGKTLNQAFLKRDFVKGRKLLEGKDLIDDAFFDDSFGKLKHSLKGLAADIKRAEQDPTIFKAANFSFINYKFVLFLNDLPDGLWNFREQIAISLINLSVKIQNTEIDFCYDLYLSLKSLKCEEDTRKIIEQNMEVFSGKKNKKATPKDGEKSSSGRGCLTIGGIFFVLFLVLRACLGTFNGTQSSMNETIRKFEKDSKFPTTEEVITQSRNIYRLDNHQFKQKLREITELQLKPASLDSMQKYWAVHPKTPSMDNWPYSKSYEDLMNTTWSQLAKPLKVTNNSEYDAVLFIHNDEHVYSAYLDKGKTLKTRISNDDMVSLYIGNQWNTNSWFEFKSIRQIAKTGNTSDKLITNGLFTKTDSTTLLYLDTYWKFNCRYNSCDTVKIEFTSPVKESLRFDGTKDVFEMLEGDNALHN